MDPQVVKTQVDAAVAFITEYYQIYDTSTESRMVHFLGLYCIFFFVVLLLLYLILIYFI